MRTSKAVSVAGSTVTALVLAAAPAHAQRYCDTKVVGVRLYDGGSFREFQKTYGRGSVKEEFGFREILYYNSAGNEALTFIVHPGAEFDDVGEVRLERRRAKSPSVRRVPERRFTTSRGVVLGMTRTSLETAFGQPTSVVTEKGRTTLRYRCEAGVGCECAVRANMPEYEAFYVFEADSLVHAEFGFPYP